LRLGSDDVHIWCAALDQLPGRVSRLAQLLSVDERERAGRLVFEQHRQHFIVGRGLLRLILGRYLELAPDQLKFEYGRQGKPALANLSGPPALAFNLSHSHGLALYAVASNRALGVDVEAIRRLDDLEAIAKRFFSATEYTVLSSLPPAQKPTGFFNCWTRKEAYIKAIGDGLSYPLDRFDVSLRPGEPARLLRVQDDPQATGRWSLYHLAPVPGYVGAVVAAGQPVKLSCWRWAG
jgi:4'-phosphopantetheinyl transferase